MQKNNVVERMGVSGERIFCLLNQKQKGKKYSGLLHSKCFFRRNRKEKK